jgi:osmotically-inducible protein OsmY
LFDTNITLESCETNRAAPKRVRAQTQAGWERSLEHHRSQEAFIMKSDGQLQLDINAELAWDPAINSEDIAVKVSDGVVTLAGHVRSYAEKMDAERAALRVSGVKALAVEMEVRLGGDHTRQDVDIARSAKNVLEWTAHLPKDKVKVTVENGWVTLTGEVHWEYQRQSAVSALRYLIGVKGVYDQLLIKPSISAPVVKADIEAALKRRAQQDAKDISVSVSGSDVTLSGRVHTWSERELATNTAWRSPGVSKVINNITLAF